MHTDYRYRSPTYNLSANHPLHLQLFNEAELTFKNRKNSPVLEKQISIDPESLSCQFRGSASFNWETESGKHKSNFCNGNVLLSASISSAQHPRGLHSPSSSSLQAATTIQSGCTFSSMLKSIFQCGALNRPKHDISSSKHTRNHGTETSSSFSSSCDVSIDLCDVERESPVKIFHHASLPRRSAFAAGRHIQSMPVRQLTDDIKKTPLVDSQPFDTIICNQRKNSTEGSSNFHGNTIQQEENPGRSSSVTKFTCCRFLPFTTHNKKNDHPYQSPCDKHCQENEPRNRSSLELISYETFEYERSTALQTTLECTGAQEEGENHRSNTERAKEVVFSSDETFTPVASAFVFHPGGSTSPCRGEEEEAGFPAQTASESDAGAHTRRHSRHVHFNLDDDSSNSSVDTPTGFSGKVDHTPSLTRCSTRRNAEGDMMVITTDSSEIGVNSSQEPSIENFRAQKIIERAEFFMRLVKADAELCRQRRKQAANKELKYKPMFFKPDSY